MSREPEDANVRAGRRARLQTPGFDLARHLVAFGALAVAALGLAGWMALAARLADLWIVPAYLVAANVVEKKVRAPIEKVKDVAAEVKEKAEDVVDKAEDVVEKTVDKLT